MDCNTEDLEGFEGFNAIDREVFPIASPKKEHSVLDYRKVYERKGSLKLL